MKHYPLFPSHIEKALAYPDNYDRAGWFAYLLDTFVPKQHTEESASTIAATIAASGVRASQPSDSWRLHLSEVISLYYDALIHLSYSRPTNTIFISAKGLTCASNQVNG